MKIQAHNSEEWLDDYLMGRLPEADELRAEELLFEHPQLAAALDFRQEVVHRAKVDGERIFTREIEARRHKPAAISWRDRFAVLFRRPALIGGLAMAVVAAFVIVRLADNPNGDQTAQALSVNKEAPGDMSVPRPDTFPPAQAAPESFSEETEIADSDKEVSGVNGRPGPDERPDLSGNYIESFAMAEPPRRAAEGDANLEDFGGQGLDESSDGNGFGSAPEEQTVESDDAAVATDNAPLTADLSQFSFDSSAPWTESVAPPWVSPESLRVVEPVVQDLAVNETADSDREAKPQPIAQMRFGDTSSSERKLSQRSEEEPQQNLSDGFAVQRSQIDDGLARSRSMYNSIGRMMLPAPDDTLRSFPPVFEWTERQPSGAYLIVEDAARREIARFRLEDDVRSFTPEDLELEAGTYEWYLIGENYLSYRSRFHVAQRNDAERD